MYKMVLLLSPWIKSENVTIQMKAVISSSFLSRFSYFFKRFYLFYDNNCESSHALIGSCSLSMGVQTPYVTQSRLDPWINFTKLL